MNKTGHWNLLATLIIALSLFVVVLSACSPTLTQTATQVPEPTSVPPTPTPTDAPAPIGPDYWPTAGWRTSTPEEQGMDSQQLAEMIDYLHEQNSFTIHSLLIIRNGYIVTDAYFYPFARDSSHELASATKSFMSTLVGIAIDKGYIEGVEQPVLDFFPERTVANLDADKEAMTLEDLLTMRSGFECIPTENERTLREMMASPDWVQFTLDLPMAGGPRTRWVYCSPNPHLLSAIILETSGMSALDFAQEHLFGPLGVSDVLWPAGPQGNNNGWGDLMMTPHDMAKLGYLYLHHGEWDGQQVVSASWVESASSALTPAVGGSDYGYLWWVDPSGLYYVAAGKGGQEIYVLPDQDMVVVMTGASGGGGPGAWGERLFNSHIIPLAGSATPLSPNPDGVAALESKIQEAAAPVHVQPEPVPPMPETAHRVSGQTILMDSNPVGLQSGSLSFPEEAESVLSLTFADGSQIEWRIGLDNVWRFSPGFYGLLTAAKGAWESDSVFVFQLEEIGGSARNRYRISFEDDRVTIQMEDLNGYDPVMTLAGRLEE